MNAENIFKSLFTTLLGAVIISFAFYGWWEDYLTDWQGIVVGCIGFALMWMRDEIPQFISKLFNKKIDDGK